MNRRIEHITGLQASAVKNFSEPFMCGNYGIGGHYWMHPDYHHDNPESYLAGRTGNRVATILTVLAGPEAGNKEQYKVYKSESLLRINTVT